MKTRNNVPLKLNTIPIVKQREFYQNISDLLSEENSRCINYFAAKNSNGYTLYCAIVSDSTGEIDVQATEIGFNDSVISLTPQFNHIHVFEREMHEQYGIKFIGHPWLKPVRYSYNRQDKNNIPDNYPFFSIDNYELHEVGVGPIHAGIIEPGHFRFICEGEKVLHLEIVLGYQHRGIESMMTGKPCLKKMLLSESIAGDSVIGHSLTYASGIESLAGILPNNRLKLERSIALELERMAIHIGDTSALCLDIAYQLGQVACEALRTIVINTTQMWCGNRFGKGLIRPAGTNYPSSKEIYVSIRNNLFDVITRYREVAERMLTLPSLLARFEDVGTVTQEQAILCGLTGTCARATGLKRDIRKSHPFQAFNMVEFAITAEQNGDILSRLKQRISEIEQSYSLINKFLSILETNSEAYRIPQNDLPLVPNSICITLTEGWRGEICHTIITDGAGDISTYKIKDPSLHNWFGLALAVRNQDISDFPICNKSFNLSYCGFDL